MLISFTVENYLSFSSSASFSMVAAESVDYGYGNTISLPEESGQLLKSAVIYGANGAGKSNFISALLDFRDAILNSFSKDNLIKIISRKYFRLDVNAVKKPSRFEILFLIGSVQYRYGFELQADKIVSEWLFKRKLKATKESCCFRREGQRFIINHRSYKGATGVPEKTRQDSLFISACALFDVAEAQEIRKWFSSQLIIPYSLYTKESPSSEISDMYQSDSRISELTVNFMKLTDMGIRDINLSERPYESPNNPDLKKLDDIFEKVFGQHEEDRKVVEISTEHDLYKNNKRVGSVKVPLYFESEGSKRAFYHAVYLFDSLIKGKVLVLDEFGANLHTQLSYEFLKLFQGSINKNSQLIIATHDTNLLRKDLFRRDQVWFAEKDKRGNTDLYSLVEFKINRNNSTGGNSSIETDYLQGKYGAIPCFGDIDRLIKDFSKNA